MMTASKPLMMVVDDQPDVLEVIMVILEREGYQVWTATNGRHALQRLEAALTRWRQQGDPAVGSRYLPDLIISDILMPVMDGYTFYEQTRANPYLNHIPFIFLTAMQHEDDIRRGKELGVDDYLTKPIQMEDLLASVHGKLKRTTQQRAIAAQTVGEPGKFPMWGVIMLLTLLLLIVWASRANSRCGA
jgi:two-component system, OmpR family, alkaline phosphatase synthesis response regulator PhoP